jgi:hypothetical protein
MKILHPAMAAALAFAIISPAYAGVPITDININGKVAYVQLPDGTFRPAQADTGGNIAISGTLSASFSSFAPNGNVANLPITTSSANVALPTASAVVAVTNDGASDVSVKLSVGASAAATTDWILKAGATTCLAPGSNTFINAITAASTSHLSMAGGAGGCAGYGGGGSGGAAGTVAISQTTPGTTNAVFVTNNGTAQGAAIAGQTPSTVACQNLTANPTAYTTATTNVSACDEYGATVTRPYALGAGLVQGTTATMTGTTSTSLVAAPGAGLRNYITNITCVNSHATVGTFITVQDGSGGTALYTLAAAALFGGAAITFPAPLRQPTANTALYVANVTTGANDICSATGYKAP